MKLPLSLGTSITIGEHSRKCLLARESWAPDMVACFSLVTLGGCGVYGLWNESQPTCNGIAQGGPNRHEFQATARHTSVSASKLLQ
jgi:hypothetical protein